MQGQIISQEFSRMVWVTDKKRAQYSCYIDQDREVKNKEDLSKHEQESCMNLNAVLGDSW